MLKIKNEQTGEELKVSNIHLSNDGRIVGEYEFGTRFYNKYGRIFKRVGNEGDQPVLGFVSNDWELSNQQRKSKQMSKSKQSEPIVAEPIAQTFIPTSEETVEPIAQQQTISQPYSKQATNTAADIFGGIFEIVEQRVTENVQKMIQPALKNAVLNVQLIDTKGITHKIEGVVHEKFEVACQLVHDGFPVYFYGASGSGKNVLAEQVAKGLGLDYYYQSCVKDDFVLTGNPTANGGYCESEFYKAFSKGGLFVLDEADSIPQDVSLTLNQAIANGEFTFPVIGTVKAHKDFRIIACGNTSMGGASIEYNGRYAQDGAFKNRFAFVRVDYDTRIEEAIADHDAEILDFIRGLRKAAEDRHITLICGYRQIKGLATYRKIMKPEDVIDMFVTQGMRIDELRILNEGLQDIADNQYAKAFKKMAKAA